MSFKRGWFAFACLLLAPIALPLAADEPKTELSGDLKAFQGEWVAKDDMGESTWTFKGDELHLKAPGREYDVVIKLDADAKPEKAIDFAVKDDSPNAAGFKAPGIYKLDGEKLVICFGAGGERPKEFQADFQMTFLWELARKK